MSFEAMSARNLRKINSKHGTDFVNATTGYTYRQVFGTEVDGTNLALDRKSGESYRFDRLHRGAATSQKKRARRQEQVREATREYYK